MSLFGSGIDPRLKRIAEEYREKLKADPTDVAAALGYAAALAQFDHRRDAVSLLSRTGAALMKKGRLVEAMGLYKRVGEIDPKGEVTASFMVGLELAKLQGTAAPTVATPEPPKELDPAEKAAMAARRAKSEAVRQAASGIPLLKDVPPFLLELVLDRIALKSAKPGELLFTEGTEGSSVLFVVSGELEVFVGTSAAARLSAGAVAGEISFLSGTPRTATLRAATPVDYLELDRRAVDPILKKHRKLADALATLYKERVLDGVLARSRAFGSLSQPDRETLAGRMTPRDARSGEVLVREGATDDALFLIRRGQARVTRRKGAREAALAILGPHDVFGDVAALRRTARTATVTAVTAMELLVLPSVALRELLPGIPGLSAALDEIQLERFVATAQALAE
jgi:CRP-like cAMP-binding protein